MSLARVDPHTRRDKLTENGQYDIFDEEQCRRLLPGQRPFLDLNQCGALVVHNYTGCFSIDLGRSESLGTSGRGA